MIKKDEQLRKYAEENENLRRYNEIYKKETNNLKIIIDKKDNEITIINQKLDHSEKENLVFFK